MQKQAIQNKQLTEGLFRKALIRAVRKLSPLYMIKNPVMFVVEIGMVLSLILTVAPSAFGPCEGAGMHGYNGVVTLILLLTLLSANFAESIAEGRGQAQAASLRKTKKDT